MPTTVSLSLLGCSALLALSLAAVMAGRRPAATPLIYLASFAVTIVLAVRAGVALVSGPAAETLALPLGLPWIGAHFCVDPLSSFFLVVVNLGGAAASFYAAGYGRHEASPLRVLPLVPAFLAGMNLVVLSADAFTFLLSWEFMSLSSWALVVAHHRDADNLRAGYVYLLMASFGTLCLLLAFGLMAGADGNYLFGAMRAGTRPPALAAIILLLAILGTGSKAGLVPLHVWLPLAHPAAPSHASALMSGVMTKVAVYAFIRIVFDLLGPPEWWWSLAVLALAGITAVLGVLHALMQHDLKKLLAYHTVENIGIIFIGLGLALAFRADGMMAAAALALTAALLHVFNHSVFKSLLFFGSGAVLNATGERDMEHLGGLIHRMPQTAFLFLVGSAAISALPPFNGFVSEWLTFQAIFVSPRLPQWGLKLLVPSVGAGLALSATLAAACFVKAFGITFLGRARSDAATGATETDFFSRTAMFALAAVCLFAGILPGYFVDAISPAVQGLLGSRVPAQAHMPWLSLVPIAAGRSSYDGLLVFVFIALSATAAAFLIHTIASRKTRRAPAWDCGYPDRSPLLQYTAGSFAQPIRRVYGTLLFGAQETVVMPRPGDTSPAHFEVRLHDVIWETLYAPLAVAVSHIADRLNALQFLTIRRYLSLVFAALVLLLLVFAIWR